GPRKTHVVAFARVSGDQWSVCVVPRFTAEAWRGRTNAATAVRGEPQWPLAAWWRETTVLLPAEVPGVFEHALSGQKLSSTAGPDGGRLIDASELLDSFPVALLTNCTDDK